MKLSKRLTLVESFVTEGYTLADIGTDHGYIPISLVKAGKVPYAYACDINEGPLLMAKEHIIENGLEKSIEVRLSDGLEKMRPGEADCILIAGMGGNLIVKILNRGIEVARSAKELILSPHTESFLVREFLIENGYEIRKEAMVNDMGKYYTVIKAVKAETYVKSAYDKNPYNYIYGKYLIENKPEVFLEYLDYEIKKAEIVLNNLGNGKNAVEKRKKIKEKIYNINKIRTLGKEVKG